MKAIVETGYQGYVAHEYSPTRNADRVARAGRQDV